MTRLWDKGGDLNATIHAFTVGDDPHWDAYLVEWDCIGSAAHARTLLRAGLLTAAECEQLVLGLREISELAHDGAFPISMELEDCHTAIESYLTKTCGDAGKKIHTGRSRNDQVATAMRLFMRDRALRWTDQLTTFIETLLARIERDGATPMPGYTHLQRAMPSSVGLWLHAWAEAALEQQRAAVDLLNRLDCCPLGTGAGFGVPLPLDREYTATILGFSRVQRNPIDVQNGRGRFETYFVRVAADIGALLEKMASDLVLFATTEFGFVQLPDSMTTGSSIMPQKRNPDVLELMRAAGGRIRSRLHELECIAAKLPSSYHRDLQLTKAPAIRAALEAGQLLDIASAVIVGLRFDEKRLRAAMSPELFATAAALELVRQGVPFRDAYRRAADDVCNAGPLTQAAQQQWRDNPTTDVAALLKQFDAERRQLAESLRPYRERHRPPENTLR